MPSKVKRKWMTLFEEMIALNNVQFEHCITPSLVVLCDASRLAFAACAYARRKLSDGQFGTLFVADDLTKGISAAKANGRWFNGP